MSSAVSAHPPGGLHTEPELTSAKDQRQARALGLTSATGLVTSISHAVIMCDGEYKWSKRKCTRT